MSSNKIYHQLLQTILRAVKPRVEWFAIKFLRNAIIIYTKNNSIVTYTRVAYDNVYNAYPLIVLLHTINM